MQECGKRFRKEKEKKTRVQAEQWAGWLESQEWFCPDCWSEGQLEIKKKIGLVLDVEIVLEAIHFLCNFYKIVRLSFHGDTTNNKDAIKSLSYEWSEINALSFNGSLCNPSRKLWSKFITIDDIETEIKNASNIVAKLRYLNSNVTYKHCISIFVTFKFSREVICFLILVLCFNKP